MFCLLNNVFIEIIIETIVDYTKVIDYIKIIALTKKRRVTIILAININPNTLITKYL